MRITGIVATALLIWMLIASAPVESTPSVKEGFTLIQSVPNDVILCITEKNNPKRAFIEGYWGDELRVLFHEFDYDDFGYDEIGHDQSAYIVVPPNAAHVTALVDQADVWYNPGNMVDVEDLDAIQFHVATNPQAATPFELCISELYALFRATPSDP